MNNSCLKKTSFNHVKLEMWFFNFQGITKMPMYEMLWGMWLRAFSGIPYGDPWIASFAAVFVLIATGKIIKSIMEYA